MSLLKAVMEWREPANGGQGGRAYFFASFLWTDKEMKAPSGGATPRPFGLLIHIPRIPTRIPGTRNSDHVPEILIDDLRKDDYVFLGFFNYDDHHCSSGILCCTKYLQNRKRCFKGLLWMLCRLFIAKAGHSHQEITDHGFRLGGCRTIHKLAVNPFVWLTF